MIEPIPLEITAVLYDTRPDPEPTDRDTGAPIYTTAANALGSSGTRVDAAGAIMVAVRELNGNDTWWKVRKYTPAWTLVQEWRVNPPPPSGGVPWKIDTGSLCIVKDAASPGLGRLLITMDLHQAVSTPGRLSGVAHAEVICGFVLDPAGRDLGEGIGAVRLAPEPPPAPDPPGLTEEQVKGAVLAALREALVAPTTAALFGRWQKAAENGATVAGREAGLLTTANMGAAYAQSAEVHAQLNNVAGAQMWKVLIESHVVPPDRAPAWVRQLPGYPWQV